MSSASAKSKLDRVLNDMLSRHEWPAVAARCAAERVPSASHDDAIAASTICQYALSAGDYALAAQAARWAIARYRALRARDSSAWGAGLAAVAWLEGDWTAFRSPTWDLPASAGSPLTRHADVIWRLSLASEWDALRAWRDLAESDAPVWLEGLESRGSGVESIGRFLVRAYLATVYYWTCDARASAEVATALELASAISRSRLHHWNIRELRSELAAYSGLLEGSRTSCARAADAARDALAALVGGMDSPARRPDLALLRLRALSTEEGGPGKAEFTAFVSAFPALRSRVSSLRGQAGGAW